MTKAIRKVIKKVLTRTKTTNIVGFFALLFISSLVYLLCSEIIIPSEKPDFSLRELEIIDLKKGDGTSAELGNKVIVHYTTSLLDGIKIDSSKDRDSPLSFQLGDKQVIPGWEKTIIGMKTNGIRKLVVPANLAYGDVSGVFPENSILVFEIELLQVDKYEK